MADLICSLGHGRALHQYPCRSVGISLMMIVRGPLWPQIFASDPVRGHHELSSRSSPFLLGPERVQVCSISFPALPLVRRGDIGHVVLTLAMEHGPVREHDPAARTKAGSPNS